MGLALRLNFVDVVCDDSLKNFWANGKKNLQEKKLRKYENIG